MLFQEEHIKQIISGKKTATRRRWDKKQVIKGNSYRACTSLFTPRDESPAYIVVEDVYQQPLKDMTEADAKKEGDYTLSEFKSIWEEINDEWDPEEEVWVVEFECFQNDPKTNHQ